MSRILDIHHCRPTSSFIFFTCKSHSCNGNYVTFKKKPSAAVNSPLQGGFNFLFILLLQNKYFAIN